MLLFPEQESLEHTRAVARFARSVGLMPQLVQAFQHLNHYANQPGGMYDRTTGANTRCLIYRDWAPHSFAIVMQCRDSEQAEWRKMYHGGLVYQGPECPADGGMQSLTVSLAEGTGWFPHT